jgi:predicted TIM-barrel fold metal-dependent hydrolase
MGYKAIDVHAHYGVYDRAVKTATRSLWKDFFSGDIHTVLARAHAADIEFTLVSPLRGLMPSGGDPVAGNEESVTTAEALPEFRFWVVLNPEIPETWQQTEEVVAHPQCVGIKIHPVEHNYQIKDHGEKIFTFAEKLGVPILSHSGEAGSLPKDFVAFLNRFPDVPFIFAHLGHSETVDLTWQVEAIQRCNGSNVYVDTSSSNSIKSGLVEWAVREIGSEKILFGTDTPLYSAASQKARIEHAEMAEEDKQNIFFRNAQRLFREKL